MKASILLRVASILTLVHGIAHTLGGVAWTYLFVAPAIFEVAIAICLGLALIAIRQAKSTPE